MPHRFPRQRPPLRPAAAALAAALALGACATAPPEEPGARPHVAGLAVGSRVIGRNAAFVEVSVLHRSRRNRLVRVTLVDPDGRETEAEQVRRDEVRGRAAAYPWGPVGSIGIGGGSGGHVGVGFGVAIPFGIFSRGGYSRRLFRTRATIPIPDPERYRANPQAWRVKIYFVHRARGPHEVIRAAPTPGA